MRYLELPLICEGEVVSCVSVDDPEAWRLIDDSALAAEVAEQAIADDGLDYRVVDVQGHFPTVDGSPFIIPVDVEPIA